MSIPARIAAGPRCPEVGVNDVHGQKPGVDCGNPEDVEARVRPELLHGGQRNLTEIRRPGGQRHHGRVVIVDDHEVDPVPGRFPAWQERHSTRRHSRRRPSSSPTGPASSSTNSYGPVPIGRVATLPERLNRFLRHHKPREVLKPAAEDRSVVVLEDDRARRLVLDDDLLETCPPNLGRHRERLQARGSLI